MEEVWGDTPGLDSVGCRPRVLEERFTIGSGNIKHHSIRSTSINYDVSVSAVARAQGLPPTSAPVSATASSRRTSRTMAQHVVGRHAR